MNSLPTKQVEHKLIVVFKFQVSIDPIDFNILKVLVFPIEPE